ncbi:RNase A-like domain-containing protein [Streptomyces sp. DH12]|uniref:RNase A-like domain-containing protein n=1 Tax=Streptomyces sp. DH12 TaxID=2857010 RepID=UPI001E525E23|nr:RNase A-like domain-containing protein [Streptomyces sp. DH12]
MSRATRRSGRPRRRSGRPTRARGLGVLLSAVLSVTLPPAEAWAIAPPTPRTGPVLEELQQEEVIDPDQARMEELSSWAGGPVEPPADYEPTEVTPPAGGTTPVPLDGAGEQLVQAGALPVRIGQASPTEETPAPPAPAGTWDVTVEPRTTTEDTAVDGALIKLTPPEAGSTPVDVELDYGRFEDLFGNEWSTRLQLVQLPECFLTDPQLDECATPVTIPSSNDPGTGTVRATVDPAAGQAQGLSTQAGGGPVVLAATDSASGAGGTYKATPLSATGSWTAGGSGGGFSWSYPVTVPAPPAGPAPSISLSYSSQSVDGRTSVANGQASWIGDGWDYHPGFIERRYRSCNDDRSGTPNNGNSTDKKKSDLCWAADNVVMSLGGSSTELVHKAGTSAWTASNDTGATIEYRDKNGAGKSAQTAGHDGEHWVVTTRDGTRYWFGRDTLPGRTTRTNSTLTVPVFGNHDGEPCHAATYAASSCSQAWRWNLDYVEDVHGNAMVVDWKKEQNRYAKNEKFTAAASYDRDGYPTQILYGLRAGALTAPPAGKVVFKAAPRCIGSATTCSETKFESKNYQDKQPWWDTPSTLHCKATADKCHVTAPTFWSRVRLSSIETHGQRTAGSTALSLVDRWTLHQSFPRQRTDTHPPLWLESLSRVGFGRPDASGRQTDKDLPPVSFIPNVTDMPNRVLRSTADHTPDFDRLRIETIRTETGGEIHVDYSDPCPVGGRTVSASNKSRCFPVHWSPDPDAFADENLQKSDYTKPVEWFNKYVVEKVTEKDTVARQPDVVTSYTYDEQTGAAWARNTDEFTKPALRTYDQWRGYASVTVRKGATAHTGSAEATEQSQVTTRYFRGMSRDAGGTQVLVKDSTGTLELGEDILAHQGRAAETLTYTKAGGSLAAREMSWPYAKVTASRARPGLPALEAYRTGTLRTDSVQYLDGGRTRTVRTLTTHDDTYGLPTTAHTSTRTPTTAGGETVTDEKCTVTTYVHNTAAHLIGLPDRVRTTAGGCADAATAPTGRIISDSRTSYDALGAFGAAPTKGLPYQVDTVSGSGTGWITSARTSYDALGRATKVTDAAGNSTTTTYTPATGPAFEVTQTDAAGHATTTAVDPARGSTLSVTDPNNRKTTTTYDALGRITGIWSPSRPVNQDASARFAYRIEDSKVPAVHTRVLRDNGTYEDSYALFDGLLRPRQTQSEALGGGRIVTETSYNASGAPQETRDGYLAEGEPEPEIFVPLSLTQVPSATKTAYDGLGRPTRTTTLHEGVPQYSGTTTYGGDWTLARTAMSADGSTPLSGSRAVKTTTDALGRTTLIRHFTSQNVAAESIDTTYAYDPRGHLAGVTDAQGNTWSYTYDARGRKTSATDPDAGAAYFGHNALDQQVWTRDNQGRHQYSTYDVLGRQTELRDDSATGPLVAEWTFDTLPGAKGQPVASTRYHSGAAFTSEVTGYDTEYRPTGSKTTIPSTPQTTGLAGTYAYATTYTPTGKVQTVDLPAAPGGLAAEKVVTRYDGEGSPTTVSGLSWYTADTFLSPYGQVLRTASGEAPRRVWTTNVYDENTRRLRRTTANRETAPTPVSTTSYGYDPVGTITSITAQQPAGTEEQCFAYDPMGRLVHAWTDGNASAVCPRTSTAPGAGPARADVSAGVDGGGYWHSYGFDAIGNRTSMTVHDRTDAALDDTYTYTYGRKLPDNPRPVQPHTLTQVDAVVNSPGSTLKPRSTYAYDASGNTTARVLGGDRQNLSWDRRNKLTSVDTNDDGTADVSYLYDASGNRLVEDDGTTRTLFLGEAEIVVNTAGQPLDARRYYSSPGAPTTVRTTGGKATGHKLTVMLADHHSTSTTSVDLSAAQTVTHRRFDPYGNPRGTEPTTWPDRRTYLGVGIDDPTTGLTHIGAREYDASTGRFISVDPIMDITDPLQMNGYTYSNADPVNFSDPTGLIIAECGRQELSCTENGTKVVGTGSKDPGPSAPSSEDWQSEGEMRTDFDGDGYIAVYPTVKVPVKWDGAEKYIQAFYSRVDDVCLYGRESCADLSVAHRGMDINNWKGRACQAAGGRCPAHLKWGMGAALAGGFLVAAGEFAGHRARNSGPKKRTDCKCFPAGTDVLMADGTKKQIEQVDLGDEVLATDPLTGESGAREVTQLIATENDKRYNDLTIITERGDEALTATHEHPFWSPSEGAWVEAGFLRAGMTLLTDTGHTVTVSENRAYIERARTYNLTVADLHTYYVLAGQTPVLVHNSNCDLAAHEAAGGHAISRHVGKTDAELAARNIRYSSTFTDLAAANRATGGNLAANQAGINQWLAGRGNRLVINGPMDASGGRVYERATQSTLSPTGVTTVLQRNPSMPNGYHIVTSYPMP